MTPLAERLRDLIRDGGPQSPDHLRRGLRRVGQNAPADLIERELRANTDLFRPTGTGAWDLAERVAAPEIPTDRDATRPTDPMVRGAIVDTFVVIDVETTGTDPSSDEITQVAAVRFTGGRPTRAFNRYTRTKHATISESLRIRMGWQHLRDEELSDLDDALDEFRAFLRADTVVAWNADFEYQMLQPHDVPFPTLVDGMAAAMLVQPVGPHRLTELAKRIGVELEALPNDLTIEGQPPAQFGAHDALFDCVLTGLVHAHVAGVLTDGVGPHVEALLPELGDVGSRPVEARAKPIRRGAPSAEPSENLDRILAAQGRDQRPAQQRATELAGIGLGGAPTLVEAPTGTGKTLAYVSAALASATKGQRVALVTAFKNLQDQLIGELEASLAALDAGTTVAILKGGDNYLCRRRLANVVDRLTDDDGDLRFVAAVLSRLLDQDETATREDVTWWLTSRHPRARSLLDEVAVACQHGECGRAAAIERANSAQLVILNQVLWLAPPQRFDPPPLVVIDEAHDLEQMATLAFTEDVGSLDILAMTNRLDPAGRRGLLDALTRYGVDGNAARHLARRLRASALDARTPLVRFASAVSSEVDDENGGSVRLRRSPRLLHPQAWTHAEDTLRDLRDALSQLAKELADIANSGKVSDTLAVEDLWDIASRCMEQEDLLWQLTAVRETAKVHFLEVDGSDGVQWRLARASIDVADLLRPIWDSLSGFTLLSATLQTGQNDFTYMIDRLGLRGKVAGGAHAIDTDFPFDEHVVFGIARWFESIPTPRFIEDFEQETAVEVETLARFGSGRQLALFTARRRLEAVGDAAADPLARVGIPLLQQGNGPKAALLEEFQTRQESVLLGTRSFWQGVDVPGPSLSFLVLEKLPYPHLRDPVTEARLELIRRQCGNDFDDYLLPQMIIALKQGFGRLVRTKTDRGAVVLLDRRLHVKPYQQRVFDALPGFIPRDPEAERSRRSFYERIDALIPGLITDDGREVLDSLVDARPPLAELPEIATGGDRAERRAAVLAAMTQIFGEAFDDFRSPEQEGLFWRMLDGDDVIGLLPTGAGKSLPFQLAALVTPGVTLVISPLVALMRDQVENLLDKGVRAVGALVGAMSADERDETLRQAATGGIRLLYVAPERLRDPVFLDRIANLDIQRLVVDEAHCVSLWGPSFRPDFLAIRSAMAHAGFHDLPTAALTATATPEIESDIRRSLALENAERVAMSFARPELQFAVLSPKRGLAGDRIRNRKERTRLLIRILTSAERRGEAAIVYVATVRESDQIANQLRQVGLLARSYHGRLDAWSRQNVEELFREGEIDIVVATKAFGMGIDRSDVRYVIHLGHPADLESLYQEAGRAGRDGADAHCLLLTLGTDRPTQEWFIDRVAELDESIARAAGVFRELGAGSHLVDLTSLADELDVEDETQARVILHYLEAAGALRREVDQTVRARVLLLADLSNDALDRCLRSQGAEPFVGCEVDVLRLAADLGVDAAVAEGLMLDASRDESLVFRPMERHARVEVTELDTVRAPDTSVAVEAMYRKLDKLTAYIDSSECRQITFRTYLGETATEPCGRCDNCMGDNFPRPWMDVTRDSLPDADRLLDPDLTMLAAIDWNAAEVKAGRNPYGRGALQLILAADRFNLGRYVEGAERARRIRRAEASPYWGALSLVTNPAERIRTAMDRLLNREDIDLAQHEPTGPGEFNSYDYCALTEKGRDRLERGLVDG